MTDRQTAKLVWEQVCETCKNKATYFCDDCKGLGYVPTDAGDDIILFMQRHGFVQARDRR